MERRDNYAIQVSQAKARFLTYDQHKLIDKLKLVADSQWLYTRLLGDPYRIHRHTGEVQRQTGGGWVDGNSFVEVLTLLDLVCDSREDRFLAGRWKNLRDFGQMFHQNLLEDPRDPWAGRFQADPEGFHRACQCLGGRALPLGDVAYAIEVFDGLCLVLQLWFGDEEFPPNLKILWDENAGMYLRYETMFYAKDLLLERLRRCMEGAES